VHAVFLSAERGAGERRGPSQEPDVEALPPEQLPQVFVRLDVGEGRAIGGSL